MSARILTRRASEGPGIFPSLARRVSVAHAQPEREPLYQHDGSECEMQSLAIELEDGLLLRKC